MIMMQWMTHPSQHSESDTGRFHLTHSLSTRHFQWLPGSVTETSESEREGSCVNNYASGSYGCESIMSRRDDE